MLLAGLDRWDPRPSRATRGCGRQPACAMESFSLDYASGSPNALVFLSFDLCRVRESGFWAEKMGRKETA